MTSSIQKDPIQGLVDYILDIKPYHSKIAEVLVDYTINDDVNVTIIDEHEFDMVFTENYDSSFACDEGFGVLPFGGPDLSISYIPDLTLDGYITYPTVPIQLPIVYVNPFVFQYYTVVGVSSGTSTWTISGNHAPEFMAGQVLSLGENSGGGNGNYTVISATNSGANTNIIVSEAIPIGATPEGTLAANVGCFFIEGDYQATFVPGSNFTIQTSLANNGVWQVVQAIHETGQANPPLFDPTSNVTEIRALFKAPFHSFLPVTAVPSLSSPVQFRIDGLDFDQHYSVTDAMQILNSALSYNNSTWIITQIQTFSGFFIVSGDHVLDPTFAGLSISPVLNPLLILPVVSINVSANLFFVSGNHVADFGVGTFFNAVDLSNTNPNQGRWLVTSPAPQYDAINNLTRVTAQFNAIFSFLPPINQHDFGEVLVYIRSNWDLPELCKTTSITTTSSFIGETLEFIAGSVIVFKDSLDIEICDLTANVGWGAGDGYEFLHIDGGYSPSKYFYVAYDKTSEISLGLIQIINSTANDGFYNVIAISYNNFGGSVVGVTPGLNGTWIISGNHAAQIFPGEEFTIINNIGTGDGTYAVFSVTNVGPNTNIVVSGTIPPGATGDGSLTTNYTILTVIESISSSIFDGTILFQPITPDPALARTGWDDCGWDTQAALTLYQYRVNTVPSEFFTTFATDAGTAVASGFNEGDSVVVSGALPIPFPLIYGNTYYVHPTDPYNIIASPYTIVSVTTGVGTNKWTISGNHASEFINGRNVFVSGNTFPIANGNYEISSAVNSGLNTDLLVVGNIPIGATATGSIKRLYVWTITGNHAAEILSTSTVEIIGNAPLANGRYLVSSSVDNGANTDIVTIIDISNTFISGGTLTNKSSFKLSATQADLVNGIYITATTSGYITNASYLVVGVIPGVNGTWTISGNHAPEFVIGSEFHILNNSGTGNGIYHVFSATNNGLNTDIIVTTSIPVLASADGLLEQNGYQFIEKEGSFINLVSGKENIFDPGNLLNTYANTSFGESLTIAVTFGVDAGTVVGSWDYPYWDVGSYDEDIEVLNSLYGSTF